MEAVKVFTLELLIEPYNTINFNKILIEDKTGIVNDVFVVYNRDRETNDPINVNNPSQVKREELDGYIKYSVNTTQDNLDNMKSALYKFALAKEADLLEKYNQLVTNKTALTQSIQAVIDNINGVTTPETTETEGDV